MVRYCFDILHQAFNQSYPVNQPLFPNITSALFITLKKGTELRGCIGTFQKINLYQGLKKYVYLTAFHDYRFNPLDESELPYITIEISLLSEPQDTDENDWVVGVHGLIIDFTVNQNHYNATYLPEVASEQHWNQKQTIQNLIRKSGYDGNINSLHIQKYTTNTISMSHQEYLKLKK